MGRAVGGGGGAPLSGGSRTARLSGAVLGLAFFAGPVVLVALAVSARTSGVVDSQDAVLARLARHLPHARVAAEDEGVPLTLLLAVASVESAGKPDARSSAGAVGLMQLLPTTAAEVAGPGSSPRLEDPATSLRLGARYLRRQIDAFAGRPTAVELALCAYNAGPGAVGRWLAEGDVPADRAAVLAWIPYSETRAFLRRVLEWEERWRYTLAAVQRR